MTADRSLVLRAAAAARTTAATERARRALRELDRRGEPITLARVAERAGVSRQFLYDHPDLRAEIGRLRAHEASAATTARTERASDESNRVRLEAALQEHHRLRAEITRLRQELALAHGTSANSSSPPAHGAQPDQPRPRGPAGPRAQLHDIGS